MPPPAFVLFPLLKSSLSVLSFCLTLPRVDVGQLQHPSSQPETCSSGGWRAEVERLASHHTDPGPEGSPWRFRRVTEVPPSGHVVAASLTVPIFSPLFPAPKRSPAEDRLQLQTAICDTLYMLYTAWSEPHLWVVVPQTRGWFLG